MLNKILIHWLFLFTGISAVCSQKLVFENSRIKQESSTTEVYNLLHRKNNPALEIVTPFYTKPASWRTSFCFVSVIIAGFVLIILTHWRISQNKRKEKIQHIRTVENQLNEWFIPALITQVLIENAEKNQSVQQFSHAFSRTC